MNRLRHPGFGETRNSREADLNANAGREKLEHSGRAPDVRIRLLVSGYSGGRRDYRSAPESHEHLLACLPPGPVDLWIVYLCASGDGSNIRRRLYLARLLRREVQEAEQRRWLRASPGVRPQSG